ncbi:MAG: efflux RND transporter permease subunit [Thermodesulfobacteriota bacterium]
MKSAISWFAKNHVAANLLMLFVLVAGIKTAVSMKIEVFPETSTDRVSVSVLYPGASPAEVEEGIITKIEEAVAGIEGVKRVDSTASESLGTVIVEVMSGFDIKKVTDDIKSAVDRITTFPGEAEKPVTTELSIRSDVIGVTVYGDVSESTIKNLAQRVKDEISGLPDVTAVDLYGVRKPEIHIEVPEETLREYGLTLGQVAAAVQSGGLDLPAGSVKTGVGEVLVRSKGRRYYAKDYADIAVLSRADGSKVTLGRIAQLSDGFEDVDVFSRFNGKPAAIIWVYRVGDQSALRVAETVKKYIEKIRPTLPKGVDIAFFSDRSDVLKSRLDLLLRNMAWGLCLVVVLLGALMNLRLAFWVTLGIPISFAFALMLLPAADVSINMISLFAFLMVLGIVVDDAIVVSENVHRNIENGMNRLDAAVDGTQEVSVPVIYSVLTTMAAFAPLLLGGGVMGKIMRNIPIVVILVLAGSLLESMFVLPSHLAGNPHKARLQKLSQRRQNLVAQGLNRFVEGPYRRMLVFCVRWRYATIALAVALMVLGIGVWKGGLIRFTFFPKVEGDTLQCFINMPPGTPEERTAWVVNAIEKKGLAAIAAEQKKKGWKGPDLTDYSVSLVGWQIGRRGNSSDSGGNVGQIWIQLINGEKRPGIGSEELTNLWRDAVGEIPDAESVTFTATMHSAGSPVEVHLSLDDPELLIAAASDLKKELSRYPGVYDVADSYEAGKQEIQFALKPEARSLSLTLDDLARQVRHAFYGAEPMRFQRDKDEVKVLVRLPEDERRTLATLSGLRIRTPAGKFVPFSEVAAAHVKQGFSTITRAQRLRVIKVTSDVDEKVGNADQTRTALMEEFLPKLSAQYPGLRFSLEGEGKEQKESMADVFSGFLIALFAIYVLLAIPFASFSQPLIVMTAIPFGFLGALAGHLLLGYNLSILSVFGMVGLAGVVVNDSLVLVVTVNRMRERGVATADAVVASGTLRFRAVILTSLTTFAGLMPMLMEKSLQARFLVPMAISLGCGVMFATLITLGIIPSLYMILEDAKKALDKLIALLLGSKR